METTPDHLEVGYIPHTETNKNALGFVLQTAKHLGLVLLARDNIIMQSALYAFARPSVCQSKRLELGSCNFHHRVSVSQSI